MDNRPVTAEKAGEVRQRQELQTCLYEKQTGNSVTTYLHDICDP